MEINVTEWIIFLNMNSTSPSINALSDVEIKPEKKSVTQSKKNYEFVWRGIFVFISIASAILLHKVYLYQTSPNLASIRKGSLFELVIYGIPFGALFIFI